MADRDGEGEPRFLPPEPSGPEPDLGPREPRKEPGPQAQQPIAGHAPPADWQPPPSHGWQQPPAQGQPAPGWQQQPPGWHGQAPWEQPPSWQAQPQRYWQQRPSVPDNGAAVAGFVLSCTAGGLLVMSGGISSVISVVCAALGIFYSRRGRARVDRGETPKHRGLAQAGFIIGIVSLVLAVLATIGWIAVLADGDLLDDLERELEESEGTETRLGPAALRVAASLLL